MLYVFIHQTVLLHHQSAVDPVSHQRPDSSSWRYYNLHRRQLRTINTIHYFNIMELIFNTRYNVLLYILYVTDTNMWSEAYCGTEKTKNNTPSK